jgi:hypothetical protein
MKQMEMQHIASTKLSIPGSTPAVVDGNHLFSLDFDLNRKNESETTQCYTDRQYFTEAESSVKCKICIYGNPMPN